MSRSACWNSGRAIPFRERGRLVRPLNRSNPQIAPLGRVPARWHYGSVAALVGGRCAPCCNGNPRPSERAGRAEKVPPVSGIRLKRWPRSSRRPAPAHVEEEAPGRRPVCRGLENVSNCANCDGGNGRRGCGLAHPDAAGI